MTTNYIFVGYEEMADKALELIANNQELPNLLDLFLIVQKEKEKKE